MGGGGWTVSRVFWLKKRYTFDERDSRKGKRKGGIKAKENLNRSMKKNPGALFSQGVPL